MPLGLTITQIMAASIPLLDALAKITILRQRVAAGEIITNAELDAAKATNEDSMAKVDAAADAMGGAVRLANGDEPEDVIEAFTRCTNCGTKFVAVIRNVKSDVPKLCGGCLAAKTNEDDPAFVQCDDCRDEVPLLESTEHEGRVLCEGCFLKRRPVTVSEGESE